VCAPATYAPGMTDPDPDFGAGFVAAPRFARDAGITPSDDMATAQDRLAEAQRELEERADEASDRAFFDDVGAFMGDDGGAAGFGGLATQFGHGAVEAGPGDALGPLVESGPSTDSYSAGDDGLGFELSRHLADAERSASQEADMSERLNDWMDDLHGGGGGGGGLPGDGGSSGGDGDAGPFADGLVSVTDDDDFDLFQA
jgi:hypothetical protein